MLKVLTMALREGCIRSPFLSKNYFVTDFSESSMFFKVDNRNEIEDPYICEVF